MAPVPLSAPLAPAAGDRPARRDWTVVLGLMAVCFLFNIEGTIVSVAIPRISGDLGLSSIESALLASLYYIGMTLALAPVSVLASRYCVKRMLLVSLAVFAVGAVVAWRADSVPALLAARVLQGIGGGGMAAMAYGSVGVWFEPKRVGWAYGMVNSAIGAGMLLGAPLGGALVALSGWTTIFSVTAVASIGVLAICAAVLPAAFHTPVSAPFVPRLLRAILLGFGVAGTVYAVSKLGGKGIAAADVRVAGAVGLGALVATVVLEWRSAHPLVPREVWRGGRTPLALVIVSCGRGLLVVSNFVAPFLLGVVYGLSATAVGGMMAICAGIFALSGPRGAAIAQRIGAARLVSRAMMVNLAGFCVLAVAALAPAIPMIAVGVGLALIGLGTGLAVASASKSTVDSVPQGARGSLSMLLPTAGFVGMAFHVTIAEWIFAWRVEGGFAVVEHAHDAAMVAAARPGFVGVFVAAAGIAAVTCVLARRLARLEAGPQGLSQARSS
jgi:MFS family permease